MPAPNKKTKTKKRQYRPRSRRSALAPIGKSMGFPKENIVRMRYCQNVTLGSTTGILSYAQFRANSVYDPDYTSLGHQPMTFDLYATLYNHYQVLGSKMTATLLPNADLSTPHVCGIYLSDDITTYTTWDAFQESGRSKPKPLQSIDKPAKAIAGFSLKKFFTKSVDNGDTGAFVTDNPTEVAYYTLWVQPVDVTTSSSANIQAVVQIDYTVRFYEPKDIAQS